jgi:nucleoside permease NupC
MQYPNEIEFMSNFCSNIISELVLDSYSFQNESIEKILSNLFQICNTVHPVGLGMTLTTLTTICPQQRSQMFRCVGKAILGAILASFLTTAILGTLLDVDAKF